MKCPNCGNENAGTMNFCTSCGQNLNQPTPTFQEATPSQEPIVTEQVIENNQPIISQSSYPNQINNTQLNPNIGNNNYNQVNNTNESNKKKINKKVIFIVLGIILVIIIGIIFFLQFNSSKNNNTADLNSIFNPDKPIIINDNNKYGYITSDGKIMIEPKYNSATEFYNGYAIVKVDNPDDSSYYSQIYQVIDQKGNVIATEEGYYGPKYYSDYNIWVINDALYNSKIKKITSDDIEVEYISNGYFEFSNDNNNTSGIIDHTGKVYYTWEGSYIYADISKNSYDENDLYARVTISDERDKIISLKTGKEVYSVEDPESNHLYVQDDNIIREYDSDYNVVKYLFFIDGKLAFESSGYLYDLEVYNYENKILEVDYGYNYEDYGKSQRRYYYDIKNKKMLEEKPSVSSSIYDDLDLDTMESKYGYKEFTSSGKSGLMKNDKIIIPCKYDDIYFTNVDLYNYLKGKGKEFVYVEEDETTKLINLKNQKVITTFNSTQIYSTNDSTFLRVNLYDEETNYIKGYLFYNLLSNKSITVDKSNYYKVYSNYLTVTVDDKTTYYNTDMKKIYTTD